MQTPFKSVTGVLTRVDGEHFELADDERRSLLFTLAMDVSLEAGDLNQLRRDGTRVVVDYDDEMPASTPHVAHRIFRAPPPAPA